MLKSSYCEQAMAGLTLDLGRVDQDLKAELEKEENQAEAEEMDPLGNEEQLSPLERIEKFFQSDNIMERDIAIRSIIEAAYSITSYNEFEQIMEITYALASDHEPLIRIGVLGTIASLIERNCEFREKEDTPFGQENEDRLYEILIKMLNDYNQQVRRVSHNCIIALLDDPRGPLDSLIRQLCPMIKRCLGREENYDLRMDTALLIGRVSPLIDPELCRLHFVPLLSSMAIDNMFHVRKTFAMCCRDLCPSVGEECSEQKILPLFLQLCKDEVWGVRKACADVFMDVSASCSLASRHEKLTPVFLLLLRDDSRWVRKAAFQSLGPFISTFYSQSSEEKSKECTNDSSSFEPLGDSELQDSSLLMQTSSTSLDSRDQPVAIVNNDIDSGSTAGKGPSSPKSPTQVTSSISVFQKAENVILPVSLQKEAPQDEFGLFQFWRQPIPNLLLDDSNPDSCSQQCGNESPPVKDRDISEKGDEQVNLVGGADGDNQDSAFRKGFVGGAGGDDPDSAFREGEGEDCDDYRGDLTDIKDELLAESEGYDVTPKVGGDKAYSEGVTTSGLLYPKVRVLIQSTTGQVLEEETMSGYGLNTTMKSVAMEMTSVDDVTPSETFIIPGNDQEIVPDELIDMYLSMTDPNKSQSIDAELPFYCAFSFPAVLQTLGPSNWPLLKPTFEALASDMQWKIRRVLAFSLHELAGILGQDKAVSELLGILDEYCTKDLDDVKFGVLSHLADFFEILPSDVRKDYFPYVLNGLLDTENERNWRYRNLLAEQLVIVCDLFDCQFVSDHIAPVAIKMAYDRVAHVRDSASKLIGTILRKFDCSQPKLCSQMLADIRTNFSVSDRWLLRLLYIKQCQMIYHEKLINLSVFAVECIPSLITLSKDDVPNIRMAVGRLLNEAMANTEYLSLNSHFSHDLQQVIDTLRSDPDRDVRHFSGAPPSEPPTPRCNSDANSNDDVFFVQRLTRSRSEEKIDITRVAGLLQTS